MDQDKEWVWLKEVSIHDEMKNSPIGESGQKIALNFSFTLK